MQKARHIICATFPDRGMTRARTNKVNFYLVALEIGGADDLSNIWPECTAGYAGWVRGFRDNDKI
jgi:hypothetical protein